MAQINIFPAAAQAGGCSATYESYYTGTGDIGFGPQGSQYQYTNYQLIATAADGWAVDRVVYHRSWTASDGTSGTDTTTTRNISTNPFLQPENKVYTTYPPPTLRREARCRSDQASAALIQLTPWRLAVVLRSRHIRRKDGLLTAGMKTAPSYQTARLLHCRM